MIDTYYSEMTNEGIHPSATAYVIMSEMIYRQNKDLFE
jgi:lysophospholipase L1-like esterase